MTSPAGETAALGIDAATAGKGASRAFERPGDYFNEEARMARGFLSDDQTQKASIVDVSVQIHAETAKAWLVSDDGDKNRAVWVPKSQAELADGVLTLPEWLAKEKKFI